MTHEADTPRTDAVMASSNWPYHITSEMQKLERELNELWLRFDKQMEAEAEVNKLNHQLLKAENDLLQSQDINSFLDTEFRIACKRAERAEAEVASLNELLESTKQLALKFWKVLEENGFKMELK